MFGLNLRRNLTQFIVVNTHKCIACGECVNTCNQGILILKGPSFHRHIRITNGDLCTGCLKCIRVCESKAIRSTGG